jgi:hypothetical protein
VRKEIFSFLQELREIKKVMVVVLFFAREKRRELVVVWHDTRSV